MKVTIELSGEQYKALERQVIKAVQLEKIGFQSMSETDKLLARIYLEAKKARVE